MSFTSNSEFDLQTRVQITNEVPLYDCYQALHSSMKNPIWKWFFGWQELIRETTMDDMDESLRPIKVVNGEESPIYGPGQTVVWNPETGTYDRSWPEYHRMELNGNLLVEFDLLTHEAYRYLDTLYPNHPDWRKLLTPLEFDDQIRSSAAMVDYNPNLKFLGSVPLSIAPGLTPDDADAEAAKIKIRDLLNAAYRRKFYGSKLGYRMFGSEAFAHCAVFPLGSYLPIKPVSKMRIANPSGEFIDGSQRYSLAGAAPERKIDRLSPLYQRRFRLVDWTGDSSNPVTPDTYEKNFIGVVVPGYDYEVFEFPNRIESSSVIESIEVGSFFRNSSDMKGTTYVIGKTEARETVGAISVNLDSGEVMLREETAVRGARSLSTSRRNPVQWSNAFIIKSFPEIMAELTDADKTRLMEGFPFQGPNRVSYQAGSSSQFLFDLFECLDAATKSKIEKVTSVTFNPYHSGTLLLKPSQTLLMYPEAQSAQFLYANGMATGIQSDGKEELFSSEAPLAVGQMLATQKISDALPTDPLSVFEITGLNKGSLKFVSDKVERYNRDPVYGYSVGEPENGGLYGILVRLESGDYGFLQGKLAISKAMGPDGYEFPTAGEFSITAIPAMIPDGMLTLLYGQSYLDLLSQREEFMRVASSSSSSAENKLIATENLAALDTALTLLKQNRSKFAVTVSTTNADGEAYTSEGSNLVRNCQIVKFLKLEGNYTDQTIFWREVPVYYSAVITSVDMGSVSILPIIREGQLGFDEALPLVSLVENRGYLIRNAAGNEVTINVGTLSGAIVQAAKAQSAFSKKIGVISGSVMRQWQVAKSANITISTPKRWMVEIEAAVKADEDTRDYLTFETEEAKRLSRSLNVGDRVSGTGIQAGTLIVEVATEYIKLNKPTTRRGSFVLTFEAVLNCNDKDVSEDFTLYKQLLARNGIYEKSSPFSHGVYPSAPYPETSKAYVDGLADVSMFEPYAPSFFEVVKAIHGSKLSYQTLKKADGTDAVIPVTAIVPSTAKFDSDLFAEVSLDKVLAAPTKAGNAVSLCNKDWLNYFEEARSDLARGTDKVNFGAQLNLCTDTTGYYTLISGQTYTDPNIQALFATFNWREGSVPAYAQIGKGGAGRRSWFKAIDDVVYPDIYGASFFDGPLDNPEKRINQLTSEGGFWTKRSMWSSLSEDARLDTSKLVEYTKVDDMLFEIPLGEYDTQLRYTGHGDGANAITTVQAVFYREAFQGLSASLDKNNPDALTLVSKDFERMDVIEAISASRVGGIKDATGFDPKVNLASLYFAGEWSPALRSNGAVDYPALDESAVKAIENGMTPYFSIDHGASFGPGKEFQDSSVIIYQPSTKVWSNQVFRVGTGAFEAALTGIGLPEYRGKITLNNICAKLAQIWYKVDGEKVSTFGDLQSVFATTASDLAAKRPLKTGNLLRPQHFYLVYCVEPSTSMYTDLQFLYPGRVIGLWFDGTHLKVFGLNTNTRFGSTLPIDSPDGMAETEFREIIGRLSSSPNYQNVVPRVIDRTTTSFKLPRNCIAEGSANFKFAIDPEFISKGRRILSTDGNDYLDSVDVYFDVSSSPILYNADLDEFYVNSCEYMKDAQSDRWLKSGKSTERFAINFADQLYWKNLHSMYGNYQLKKSQKSGSSDVLYTPTLNPISGLKFGAGALSVEDKVLSVEPVKMRSFYERGLENIAFSALATIKSSVKGFSLDGTGVILEHLVPKSQFNALGNKITFASQVNDMWPCIQRSDGTYEPFASDLINLSNSAFGTPEVLEVSVGSQPALTFGTDSNGEPLATDPLETRYFKNALLLPATVDLSKPNRLTPWGGDAYFRAATQYLSGKDAVNGGVCLTVAGNNKLTIAIDNQYEYYVPTTLDIVRYANNTLVASTNEGRIYYKAGVTNLGAASKITLNQGNKVPLKGPAVAEDIFYDSKTKDWVFTWRYTGLEYLNELEIISTNYGSFYSWGNPIGATVNRDYARPTGVAATEYLLAPYYPTGTTVKTRKAYAAFPDGRRAAVIGNQLFVKSYTYLTGNAALTDSKLWKSVTPPKETDITQVSLSQMADTPAAIYELLVASYNGTKDMLNKWYTDTKNAAYQTLANLWPAPVAYEAGKLTYSITNGEITTITSTQNPTNLPGLTGSKTANIQTGKRIDFTATADADGVYNYKDNYASYAATYLAYFTGSKFTRDALTTSVKKIHGLSDGFMFQLIHDELLSIRDNKTYCTADLLDSESWLPAIFPSESMFTTSKDATDTTNLYILNAGSLFSLALGQKVEYLQKQFTIDTLASNSAGVIMVGGYNLTKAEIAALVATSSLGNTIDYTYNGTAHTPALFVSNDNGQSFVRATLPATYNGYKVSGIMFDGETWKAFIAPETTGAAAVYLTPDVSADSTLLTWVEKKVDSSTLSYASANTKIVSTDSGDILFTPRSNKITVCTPSTLTLPTDTFVTGVASDSITLSEGVLPVGTGEIKVLLSFETVKSVGTPESTIDPALLSRLVSSDGTFRVPTVFTVTNPYEADRVFIYRETLATAMLSKQLGGYPSLREDIQKEFYKYEEYSDATGAVMLVPSKLKNSSGRNIQLCQSNGDLLVNPENSTSSLSLYRIIKEGVSTELVATSPVPVFTSLADAAKAGVVALDSDLTAMFTNAKSKVTALSKVIDTPSVDFVGSPMSLTTLSKYLFAWSDLDLCKKAIVAKSDLALTTEENAGRFIEKKINNVSYVWDTKYNIFPVKSSITVNATLRLPYFSSKEPSRVDMPNLVFENGRIVSPPGVTGIFMNEQGYGGFLGNTDDGWVNTLPWEIDPEAFEPQELVNSFGEPVYLTDQKGIKLVSKKGCRVVPIGGTVPLSGDDLYASKQTISITQGELSDSLNVFRLTDNPGQLICTNDFVSVAVDSWMVIQPTSLAIAKGAFQIVKNNEFIDPSTCTFRVKDGDNAVVTVDNQGTWALKLVTKYNHTVVVEARLPTGEQLEKAITIVAYNPVREEAKDDMAYFEKSLIYFTYSPLGDMTSGSMAHTLRIHSNVPLTIADVSATVASVSTFEKVSDTAYELVVSMPISYAGNGTIELNSGLGFRDRITLWALKDNPAIIATERNDLLVVGGDFTTAETRIAAYVGFRQLDLSNAELIVPEGVSVNFGGDVLQLQWISYEREIYTISVGIKVGEFLVGTVTLPIRQLDGPYLRLIASRYVVGSQKVMPTLLVSAQGVSGNVRLNGVTGNVFARKPKFSNFQSLLYGLGNIIESNAGYEDLSGSTISVSTIDPAFSFVTFSDELPCPTVDLNDYESHVVKIKMLTRSSISLTPEEIADPKMKYQLSNKDMQAFTPDRVYFPPQGFPAPPVVSGNTLFRADNSYMYTGKSYVNANGRNIYECDSSGNYIKYRVANGELIQEVIEPLSDFTAKVDRRFNPRTPIFGSCKEWYKSEYHTAGAEQNPYWQVLEFRDVFNSQTKKFDQLAAVKSYKKAGTAMILADVPVGERYLNVAQGSGYGVYNDTLSIQRRVPYIVHKDGILQFILLEPDAKYETSDYFVKYGIFAYNGLKGGDVWKSGGSQRVNSLMGFDYSVNTAANFANRLDTEAAVVQATELGIFDKDHLLIAYAVFPPIEYNSDTQHLSFNLFIKHGSCAPLT